MKRTASIAICLAILLSILATSAAAYKADEPQVPISLRYEEIVQFNIMLNISTTGKASCYADVYTARELSNSECRISDGQQSYYVR